MNNTPQVRGMKVVLLLSSTASLLILVAAAYQENFRGEWRRHQREYQTLLVRTARDDHARRAAERRAIEQQQIYLEELGTIDRCTTCHAGVENPAMAEARQPLRTHPGQYLAWHMVDKFGCTTCHQGRGRAVSKEQAHGWHGDGTPVRHIKAPLLRGDAVYTSCGRCHYEVDLYGGEADLFAGTTSADAAAVVPIDAASLARGLPEAESLTHGKQLVIRSGCLGCHKYRGRGGVLGPDLTYVGDKGKHDFDFAHVKGEHTVEQWLFEHFMLPAEVSPGTKMPDMHLSESQARQLAHYMMGLHRKSAPASLLPRVYSTTAAPQPVPGETLFNMFCSACHGTDGSGSTMRAGLWPTDADPWGRAWDVDTIVTQTRDMMELMVPSLNHPDTLAVASNDFLRRTIAGGRHGTGMIDWQETGGLSPREIDRLVDFIRSWEPSPPPMTAISAARGNPRYGRTLYRSRCAACHGLHGEGNAVGAALNTPAFLAVASDEFLRDSIVHGRANTAMPSWKQLDADQVSDVLAYIRTWQAKPPDRTAVLDRVADAGKSDPGTEGDGEAVYRSRCATCHDPNGEGALGPSLNNDAFLSVVDDDYLYTAIVEGRPGTAMPSWTQLSVDDVVGLIHYLRGWNDHHRRELEPYVARGDWDRGRTIYLGACAGCHGAGAEGGVGIQLNNPVFLASASDAMLREWISYGKTSTAMGAFLRGHYGVVELPGSQVEDVITYLRRLETEPRVVAARMGMGVASQGAEIYADSCTACHGPDEEDAADSDLTNPDFLRAASDGYLTATIVLERSMPGLGLTAEEVANVVAFIRSWEHEPLVTGMPARYVIEADVDAGEELFAGHCSGCHGREGQGGWAPTLNNRDFLAAATDGFVQATIALGRAGTAMRAFGRGGGGLAELSSEEINNIAAYVRTWAAPEHRPE